MQEEVVALDRALGVLRDVDVRPDGSWVGVFERSGKLRVEHSHGPGFPLEEILRYPFVRAIGHDRVLLVDSRPAPSTPGGFVLTLEGEVAGTLSVGDGVEDIVVLEDLIALTYFDEGVFGGRGPAEQGIAFFELDGRLFGGYQEIFGSEAVDIADCYAASRLNGHSLAFSAYTGFQLVRVDPRKGRQEVIDVPRKLHGASAISVRSETVCFYAPYKLRGTLLTWRPGGQWHEIGHHSGLLRGLDPQRFLSKGEHGYTLVSWAE